MDLSHPARPRRASAGMTLVELLVALSVLTIGVVGFVSAFRVITRSIHESRAHSLALSLAQEKVENLKSVAYQDLQITTQTTTNAGLTWMQYDALNYPPETISVGGITFIRGVYVSLTQLTGSDITAVASNYPDSGLKYITVFVVWRQGSEWKYVQLDNLYENPNVNPLDATVQGVVRDNKGNAVQGAVVTILEDSDWTGTAGAAGSYLFQVYGGTYSVHAASAGYYDATWANTTVLDNTTLTTNFALVPIGTGTVTANVWISSGLVISQVVTATVTKSADGTTQDIEYYELFNPTTYAINIGATAGSAATQLNLYDHNSGNNRTDAQFNWTYVSTYVPPLHYYLFAAATDFFVMGHWVKADAYYGTLYANYNYAGDAAGVQLVRASDGAIYDTVGWGNGGSAPPVYSGSYIPSCGNDGISAGGQIVRVSSPPDTASDFYARAYDSGNNAVDFMYQDLSCPTVPFIARAFSSSDSTATLVAGIPAIGALVNSGDLIGPSTVAYAQNYASSYAKAASPVATFALKGVSTGTWTVLLASGAYYATVGGTGVTQYATVGIPNAGTTPAANYGGINSVFLTTPTAGGYVQGTIKDINNQAIPQISVIAGGVTLTTGQNGTYFSSVATGPVTIVANPNNVNSSFAQSIATTTVNYGQAVTENMQLSYAGTLMGFVTSDGTSGMADIAVSATSSGTQSGLTTTASSGNFYLKNISTGTYTVEPVLDPLVESSPVSITVAAATGRTVFVGTFTVTGALGTVSGTVKYKGSPLTNGALILISTAPIGSSPPTIYASSAPAQAALYAGSSKADGTYSIDVRGSTTTTYNLSAFVPIVTPSGATISTKTYSGIVVNSTTTTTQDITVP